MGDLKTVYVKVYGNGHCDVAAEAPEGLEKAVKTALQGSVRLTPTIDRSDFVKTLIGWHVPKEVAEKIALTTCITDDDAFFSPQPPY